MKLDTKEPDFTRATIHLGDDIARQLVESSRRSRPRWTELFEQYLGSIADLMVASRSRKTSDHPLVRGFMVEWARNTTWGLRRLIYSDALSAGKSGEYLKSIQAK
jgi:hypothetical protein